MTRTVPSLQNLLAYFRWPQKMCLLSIATLEYVVEPEFQFTKRVFLRKIAILFDPLGFLSLFTVRANMIMQEMSTAGTGWEESLTDDHCVKVRKWFDELK